MRASLVLLHRWFGLFMAVFLIVSGLTGAIISWDHELDEWLNPQMYQSGSGGVRSTQSALALAEQFEAQDKRAMVTYLPLAIEPGHALGMSVRARPDLSTGKAYPLDYNQVALDPATGAVQGSRMWGDVSLTRENLLPFLYKLHYSLHIPNGFGMELGVLFMGIVGIVWVIDSFIALWISFPNGSAWRKSFVFRWKQGGYRLNFDLHRSGGVWLWALLLTLAVTSVSMNLNFQVVRPVVSLFSELAPSPFAIRAPNPPDQPREPRIGREQVIALAKSEAEKRNWELPAGGVFYNPEVGIYGVGFFKPGNDHGDGGLGNAWLYFDGQDGRFISALVPGTGGAGDIFMQAQFPLHSGRILGLPGRILVSFMGLAVAVLSVTGIVIWARKRTARARNAESTVGPDKSQRIPTPAHEIS
ncbi:MAG: PepSY-associated TM helix domain-containing protein [Methylophilaceae bacterium]